MLNELAKQAHENAVDKGFYEAELDVCIEQVELTHLMTAKRLALIHGEVSEALEADRKGCYAKMHADQLMDQSDRAFKEAYSDWIKGSFEEEIADILIRVFDLAAWKGIDLDAHVAAKMRYNSLREHKHGKKY